MVSVCNCAHVCGEGRDWLWTSSAIAPFFNFWERVSHWTESLMSARLGWLSSLGDRPVSVLPALGYRPASSCSAFKWRWGLNSGLRACTNTLYPPSHHLIPSKLLLLICRLVCSSRANLRIHILSFLFYLFFRQHCPPVCHSGWAEFLSFCALLFRFPCWDLCRLHCCWLLDIFVNTFPNLRIAFLMFHRGHFDEWSLKPWCPIYNYFSSKKYCLLKGFEYSVLLFYLNGRALGFMFMPVSHFRNNFPVRHMAKESCPVLFIKITDVLMHNIWFIHLLYSSIAFSNH